MNVINLKDVAGLISPDRAAPLQAVIDGDDSSEALNAARRTLADWADHLRGKNLRAPYSPGRARLVAKVWAVHDRLRGELAARGWL